MLRTLKEAFWLRVPVPGLGALPLNLLGLGGVGILGVAEHAFWLLGLGAELAYLLALASSRRFQQIVAAKDFQEAQSESSRARETIHQTMTPETRGRLASLEGKIEQIATLYRSNPDDSLLAESNLDALQKLSELYARLLNAERQLQTAARETNETALSRQVEALQRELQNERTPLSPSLRESKQATLALVQRRLANAAARERSLAEIESDLARIQAQVDLALEEAGMQGSRAPEAAGHLNLLNQILNSNSALDDSLKTFSSPPPAPRQPLPQ